MLRLSENWVYARDHTHVVFYDLPAFEYICRKRNFELLWHDVERVVLLRKELKNKIIYYLLVREFDKSLFLKCEIRKMIYKLRTV